MDIVGGFKFDTYSKKDRYFIDGDEVRINRILEELKDRKRTTREECLELLLQGGVRSWANRPTIYPIDQGKKLFITGTEDVLFLDFVKIDPDNNNDIITFYNKYGELNCYELFHDDSWDLRKKRESIGAFSDSVEDIKRAIKYFQFVFKMCVFIQQRDIENTFKCLYDIYAMYNKNVKPDSYNVVERELEEYLLFSRCTLEARFPGMSMVGLLLSQYEPSRDIDFKAFFLSVTREFQKDEEWFKNDDEVRAFYDQMLSRLDEQVFTQRYWIIDPLMLADEIGFLNGHNSKSESVILGFASRVAEIIINAHIKTVNPIFTYNTCNPSCLWFTDNLLSAIYFQFNFSLNKKEVFRMCANRMCKKPIPMYGADKRKRFCDHKCADAEGVRIRREKKRDAKIQK